MARQSACDAHTYEYDHLHLVKASRLMLRAGRSPVVALAAAGGLLASQGGSGAVERLQVAPGAIMRTKALPGCSKDASIRTASAVIAAFNGGDAENRSTLGAYVRQRHR